MNGICKALDCYFGAHFDPGTDEWIAGQVHRDGNMTELGRAKTEEEAEVIAGRECRRQLECEVALWRDRYDSLMRDAQASERAFDRMLNDSSI